MKLINIFFIFLFFCFSAINTKAQINAIPQQYNTAYVTSAMDTLAGFVGGADALYKYIVTNFRVGNEMQRENGGHAFNAICILTIDSIGEVESVNIDRSAADLSFIPVLIEVELRKVFKAMPLWHPARKATIAVRSDVVVPIRFILRDNAMEIYNIGTLATVGISKSKSTVAVKIILFIVSVALMIPVIQSIMNHR